MFNQSLQERFVSALLGILAFSTFGGFCVKKHKKNRAGQGGFLGAGHKRMKGGSEPGGRGNITQMKPGNTPTCKQKTKQPVQAVSMFFLCFMSKNEKLCW